MTVARDPHADHHPTRPPSPTGQAPCSGHPPGRRVLEQALPADAGPQGHPAPAGPREDVGSRTPAGTRADAEPSTVAGVGARVLLVRVAELGPPADGVGGAVGGWRSAAVAGLPRLEAPPGVGGELRVAARRAPRVLVTEAQARDLVRSTARLVFEVLDGRRPLRQLERVLSERALSAVRTMLRGGLRWPVRGATVHSVHLHQPSARAIEASVVFHSERRHRALALRMDRNRHGWLATAIRIA